MDKGVELPPHEWNCDGTHKGILCRPNGRLITPRECQDWTECTRMQTCFICQACDEHCVSTEPNNVLLVPNH